MPDSHRLPALLLVFLGGGFGGLLFELTDLPVFRCLDMSVAFFPFLGILANPHFTAGTALLVWALWAFCAVPGRRGVALGTILGTALGLVRPYDLALLGGDPGLGVVALEPPRRWVRAGAPLLGLVPVLAYDLWLFFGRGQFASFRRGATFPPWGDFVPALGPALALALFSLRGSGAPRRAWPGRTCGPGRRSPAPSWLRGPARSRSSCSSAPECPSSSSARRGSPDRARADRRRRPGPQLQRGGGHAGRAERRSQLVRAAREDGRRPGAARSLPAPGTSSRPPRRAQYAVGLSRCHALFAHPATPDYEARLSEARGFYATWSPSERSDWLDRHGVTHLVLPGDAGPCPAGWLGAGHAVPAGRTGGPGPRARDLRPASPGARRPPALTALMSGDVRPAPDPFHAPWFDEREVEAVREALAGQARATGRSGAGSRRGSPAMLGARACCSRLPAPTPWSSRCWRSAIGPGQEVICPSFTFVSSANAVLRVGARPVFADIEERTLGLDPADVERRLTPRTAAILPVHYAGVAPDMEALLDIARRRGLRVVEDAAQGIAASWRGRALGTLGDAGCLSFHETKNLSCGEGGALVVVGPRAREARRDRAREGHQPRGVLPRRGGQVHLGRGGLELRAVGRARRDPGRAARQAGRDPGAARRGRRPLPRGLADWAARARRGAARRAARARAEPPRLLPALPRTRPAATARCAALRARGVMATFHYVPLHSAPHGRRIGAELRAAGHRSRRGDAAAAAAAPAARRTRTSTA